MNETIRVRAAAWRKEHSNTKKQRNTNMKNHLSTQLSRERRKEKEKNREEIKTLEGEHSMKNTTLRGATQKESELRVMAHSLVGGSVVALAYPLCDRSASYKRQTQP